MTINNVSSSASLYQTGTQSAWKQGAQDFKALQSALQSGDLSGAQQAFATLQQDLPSSTQTTKSTATSSQTTPTAKDFQALQSALSSGDLSGAQQAFASLKQDLQSAGKAHKHQHHHSGSESSATPVASSTPNTSGAQPVDSALNLLA